MKQCPKCGDDHNKPGTFCSRKCANSRIFTDEAKQKKSIALAGKPRPAVSPAAKEQRIRKISETWQAKYQNTPFEQLGSENKRRRVLDDQHHCCNRCGLAEWMGQPIALELEHKDGNNQNNIRDNLEALCPNCHSVTPTWRGRNKPSRNGINMVTDDELIQQLQSSPNTRQALLSLGLSAKGGNYTRANLLLEQLNKNQS